MFSESIVTGIYCMTDDFRKEFSSHQKKYMLEDTTYKFVTNPNRMSDSEIIVVLILFHSGGFRCFKHYYQEYVCKHLFHLFPKLVLSLRKETSATEYNSATDSGIATNADTEFHVHVGFSVVEASYLNATRLFFHKITTNFLD